jgi:MEMO1 family protein
MRTAVRCVLLMGLLFTYNNQGSSQNQPCDRKPAVAGRFYPSDPAELRAALSGLFTKAEPSASGNLKAIIVPHAGYIFSGKVAASGYNQIDPGKIYDNIFILASSHQHAFPGASIYNQGDYMTPLGKVKVNKALANKLIATDAVFCYNKDADATEHSLEVQIPFLQYHMKHDFSIVPIVLGTQSAESCKRIALLLKPYFNGNNLFVISSDFSHYPSYSDAIAADRATCNAIISNSPDTLLKFLEGYQEKEIPNLATNLCGWTSVLTLLNMTTGDQAIIIKPVQYQNSGDSKHGDKTQVVGYWSLAVYSNDKAQEVGREFNFTDDEKKTLLSIARKTMNLYVGERRVPGIDTTGLTENLKMFAGAFVTLKRRGELRGCIGRFSATMPLYKVVQEMAVASSTEDSRFEPVTPAETAEIEVEISVLSPMRRINSPGEIVLGKHGIYIKKGYLSGTFLPQVATETGWDLDEFLGHCARDKAGIGWDGWKGAEIFVYEACVFSEHDLSGRK